VGFGAARSRRYFTGRARASGRARQHLAALDERIRRMQWFRRQLAGDLSRWNRQQAATTEAGLCRWIAEAEPAVDADVAMRLGRAGKDR
jgi:hypothetical protein